MKVDFTFTRNGLGVDFRSISREVPVDSIYLWDFGDFTSSSLPNPSHTYEYEGFYEVTLTITPSEGEPGTTGKVVGVSEYVQTILSDSIYNLIDTRIPANMIKFLDEKDKRVFIEKWQLYIQPLICSPREVPLEFVYDELHYEALHNQLIMEAAAYDWLLISVINLLQYLGHEIQGGGEEGEEARSGGIKKIETGPTNVEYFDTLLGGDSASSLIRTLTNAISPGGIIDLIKQNLCMLAERLSIYLPICDPKRVVTIPIVTNRRKPGLLGGPNPSYPVRKSGKGKPKSRG